MTPTALLIYHYRTSLKLSQAAFGQRFNVSAQAVHYWESGRSDTPSRVLWAALQWAFTQQPSFLASLVGESWGAGKGGGR